MLQVRQRKQVAVEDLTLEEKGRCYPRKQERAPFWQQWEDGREGHKKVLSQNFYVLVVLGFKSPCFQNETEPWSCIWYLAWVNFIDLSGQWSRNNNQTNQRWSSSWKRIQSRKEEVAQKMQRKVKRKTYTKHGGHFSVFLRHGHFIQRIFHPTPTRCPLVTRTPQRNI